MQLGGSRAASTCQDRQALSDFWELRRKVRQKVGLGAWDDPVLGGESADGVLYQGLNGDVLVADDGVIIRRRGTRAILTTRQVRGDKLLPYNQIAAVEVRPYSHHGMVLGYLRVTVSGAGSDIGREGTRRQRDENTITFLSRANDAFKEAGELIRVRMREAAGQRAAADETKMCPDCAENVKAAARVCRYCGHRFEDSE